MRHAYTQARALQHAIEAREAEVACMHLHLRDGVEGQTRRHADTHTPTALPTCADKHASNTP